MDDLLRDLDDPDWVPDLPLFGPDGPPSPDSPPAPPRDPPPRPPRPPPDEDEDIGDKEIYKRIRKVIGDHNKKYKGKNRKGRVPVARHGFVHPPLPITAPDYSYVMDITDMRSLLAVRLYFKTNRKFHFPERITHHRRRIIDDSDSDDDDLEQDVTIDDSGQRQRSRTKVAHEMSMIFTNAQNNHRVNRGYNYLLTILDTTSRKAWAYPLKRKDQNEVYTAFRKFLGEVHGKIARLLSDNDTGFRKIMNNNNTFTYCLITAGHHNHKTFGLIDRFTRTFRDLLYKFYCYYAENPTYSWYDAYRIIIRTYNISKHRSLFLRGYRRTDPEGLKGLRKFYYSPDQVWYNPRLRSRIRLRMYFDGYKNYLPGTLYDRIKNADKVRVREWSKNLHKGGESYFSEKIHDKGIKRGNSWFVNGTWYTYRNIWPVSDHQSHDKEAGVTDNMSSREKTARRDMHRDKYDFDDAIDEFMHETDWVDNHGGEGDGEGERDDDLSQYIHTTRKKALDVGRLIMDQDPDYAKEGESVQDVGVRAMEELRKNKNGMKRNLRASTMNPAHIHALVRMIQAPVKERKRIKERIKEVKKEKLPIAASIADMIKKEGNPIPIPIPIADLVKMEGIPAGLPMSIKIEGNPDMSFIPIPVIKKEKKTKRIKKEKGIKTEKGGRFKSRSKRNNKKKHTKRKR